MLGIGKSAEQRRREKERKQRGTRKYGQPAQRFSRKGVLSCISGAGALAILLGCVFYAFLARGKAFGIVGGIAIISLILSIYGIRCAMRGFYERERNYLPCKIGLPLNAAALILFFAIFIGGLS